MRRAARLATVLTTACAAALAVAAPAQAADLPEGGLPEAVYRYVATPDQVPGANDWSCTPTAQRPNPVVLLPGTFANLGANFVKLSPRLANAGFCVFALNYGHTDASFGRVGGLAPVTSSAAELAAFVDEVRAATGAAKVDVVGHSQGGNVPLWWMMKLGGAAEVAHYVGWGPSSHGTTLNGLSTLLDTLNLAGFATGLADALQFPGVLDQRATSDYTKALWSAGPTVPDGPKYTVITSRFDTVVTPPSSQALDGRDVNNVLLQDRCPADVTGHVGHAFDDPTMQLTVNALTDGPDDFQPRCTGFGPPFT